MNDPKNQPPQSISEEVALESELKRLQPAAVPPAVREVTLRALRSADLSADEQAFAQSLERLRPAKPSAQLWSSIEAKLGSGDGDTAEVDKIVSMPRWRDFAPIFKMAAMVAIGLFAAVSILRQPTVGPETSVSTKAPTSGQQVPNRTLSGQPVLISHTGTLQDTRLVKYIENGKQVYEQRLETRKDLSRYHLSPDLKVEDEVTRQTKVYSPRSSF